MSGARMGNTVSGPLLSWNSSNRSAIAPSACEPPSAPATGALPLRPREESNCSVAVRSVGRESFCHRSMGFEQSVPWDVCFDRSPGGTVLEGVPGGLGHVRGGGGFCSVVRGTFSRMGHIVSALLSWNNGSPSSPSACEPIPLGSRPSRVEYDNHGEGSSPRQAIHDKQQQLNADESDGDMLISPNVDQAVDQSRKDPKEPKKNMAMKGAIGLSSPSSRCAARWGVLGANGRPPAPSSSSSRSRGCRCSPDRTASGKGAGGPELVYRSHEETSAEAETDVHEGSRVPAHTLGTSQTTSPANTGTRRNTYTI